MRPVAATDESPPRDGPSTGPGRDHRRLIARLRRRIRLGLSAVLRENEPVALLDFPDYPNVGDSAIWLGERAALWDLGLPAPAYSASQREFRADDLRTRMPEGTILLSGGGNLGDLYPGHQTFREKVIEGFPSHRIVILPQSIHFRSESALERARRVFHGHRDLHLFVRTERSRRIAERHFSLPVRLCPDMAFALGSLPQVRTASGRRPLLLLRQDDESVAGASWRRVAMERGLEVDDWAEPGEPLGSWEKVTHWLRWAYGDPRRIGTRALSGYLRDPPTRVAWARLLYGIERLSGREFVVTDRLHGHILSLLLGIPHAVVDNSYGKNRAYVSTWTGNCELTGRVDRPSDCGWPESTRSP